METLKNVLKKFKYKILEVLFDLPIFKIDNKKIVIDNFNGKGFGCNPKYIALELIKEKIDCKIIWLVTDLNTEMSKEIKKVKYGSLKSYYELATAKIWIDNVRNYKGVKKKESQFYIQTWHAPLGLKKVEGEVEDKLDKNYLKETKNDAKITNLMLTNNNYMEKLYREKFCYKGEIYSKGLPRQDIILNQNIDLKEKIYKSYHIDMYKKIILYAPTFRKDFNERVFIFDYKKCCEVCKNKFSDDFILCIRLHPNIAEHFNDKNNLEDVVNVSLYPDMQELLAISDIVITDFSSVMFDFSMANKKVFLYANDLKEYIENDRSFSFELDKLPFKFAQNQEELFENIKEFNYKDYIEKCKKFYKNIGLSQSNNSAKEIVGIIREKLK